MFSRASSIKRDSSLDHSMNGSIGDLVLCLGLKELQEKKGGRELGETRDERERGGKGTNYSGVEAERKARGKRRSEHSQGSVSWW